MSFIIASKQIGKEKFIEREREKERENRDRHGEREIIIENCTREGNREGEGEIDRQREREREEKKDGERERDILGHVCWGGFFPIETTIILTKLVTLKQTIDRLRLKLVNYGKFGYS